MSNVSLLSAHGVAYASQIAAAADRHGVDPVLLAAVAAQETGGPGSNAGRNIVGDGGHGRGVFQIDDRYHAFARSGAAMDPQANADYAATMIAGLLRQYGGDVREALSAYNAGDPHARGTMTTWQDGCTLGYADSVLRHYSGISGGAPSSAHDPQPADEQLLDHLGAESATEQQQVNQLAAFAINSAPAPLEQQYSYRRLAGLDDFGHSHSSPDFGSLVCDDDEPDDPFDLSL